MQLCWEVTTGSEWLARILLNFFCGRVFFPALSLSLSLNASSARIKRVILSLRRVVPCCLGAVLANTLTHCSTQPPRTALKIGQMVRQDVQWAAAAARRAKRSTSAIFSGRRPVLSEGVCSKQQQRNKQAKYAELGETDHLSGQSDNMHSLHVESAQHCRVGLRCIFVVKNRLYLFFPMEFQ